MRRPPGPRGLEWLRTILGRRRDPVQLLMDLRARYGSVVHIKVGDTSQFIISSPDDVKHVLVDNHRNYTKGPGYELLAGILGRGLVTSEGDHWRRHRRLVQPVLQRERLRAFVGVMAEATNDEVVRLRNIASQAGTVDAYRAMMDLALRIISRTMLGAEAAGSEATVHHAMTVVLDHIERISVSPLRVLELLPGGSRTRGLRKRLATLPTAKHREFKRAVADLDRIIYQVIDARRRDARGDGERDLVSLLLAAPVDDEPLSDVEIRDEVMTMFLAGHETTATALAWCLHLLALHPRYRDAIENEAEDVLGQRDPTLDDLSRLTMTHRIVEEAMRLYPPVWRLSRFAIGADTIAGYEVEPGSVVVISPYLMHHDPSLWPDPQRFDPERFAPEQSAARHRLAFMPFGTGQRMCIGSSFAIAEMQVILSVMCRALIFAPVGKGTPSFEARVTLRPSGGMPLRVVAVTPTLSTVRRPG